METTLRQMDKLKKAKNWIAKNKLILFIVTLIISSCQSQYINGRKYVDVTKENCGKFTLNYSQVYSDFPDSISIYGNIKICATGEKSSNAAVLFTGELGKEFKTKADSKGNYKVKIIPGFYKIHITGSSSYLQIPDMYLGDHGNVIQMDFDLIRVPVLDDSSKDKSLEKELKHLKKKSK
ncbi:MULTISPECIES: hypothetical protein [unclassified Sphingobacterium]|uniref:hypothetical protein n=1 Tax=unclassified Sphingobacterium TaxID=2609468 RepID=UPI0010437041|nr:MULTISPECIES: hypothetical protein [unclassified Sphingobacterium]MCS3552729.1 ribosomal protein L21E [Sphingobacterium sp. JUb21]TCR10513.1 hypothetical protein EDF66_101327 [Sphingobacterium sp. JUb20]